MRGFGGFFLDAQGNPTIYLKDAAERANAGRALEPWLGAHGRNASQLRVLQGEFEWAELESWFKRISPEALALAGVVFVDADEAANRVRVGVVRGAGEGQLRALVARLGIPAAAVVVTETEPIRALATLRDEVRPTVGGLQINFPGFLCTLGFNAVSGGQNSFITASHCTDTQGGVEDTPYGQPLLSVSGTIATEVADPEYSRGGVCPRGRRCRFSDASRAAYATGVAFDLGSIARTPGPNIPVDPANLAGALGIVASFQIGGESAGSEFVIGSTLNKVGRTTGWTQGTVRLTCVDTGVLGSNIVQLCQTFVTAGVAGGDSGSPVFELAAGPARVTLAGILWGGGGGDFVFSPMANIEQELGPLTTR